MRYIYRNELDKACFQHDSAYDDHKDLINRTKADKVLRDKAYNIASNPKYDGYQRVLASMAYKFFDKKSAAGPSSLERMGSEIKKDTTRSSLILADELHKPVIKKFKGALSRLRRFLATESPFKMMKNAFYFTSKALFVLKIFKLLS